MSKRMPPSLMCFLALTILMVSCGKKTSNSKTQSLAQEPRIQPVETDTEVFLSKQLILCEEGEDCPNYIAKIVVFDNHKVPRICTGFLVNDQTVATSTSCLPALLRLKGQDCSADVTFFLPAMNGREAERISCSRVLQISDLGNKEAVLWRDDVAFLELAKPVVGRRSLQFHREGFENHKKYTYRGVEQLDDKTGIIRRQSCEAIHHSWVNPLSSKTTSPNMLFAGCDLKNGQTGGPIIDGKGRVMGMVSAKMDPKVREYLESTGLLTQKLKPMFHASNFSCAPTIFDTRVVDDKECNKVINQDVLKASRNNMLLERDDFYEGRRKAIQDKISAESRFLNFTVELVVEGEMKRAVITPKCFKNVRTWINTLDTYRGNYTYRTSFPQLAIKRTMDAEGRFGAMDVDNGKIDYYLQFSVKQLKRNGVSDVYLWNADVETVYERVGEGC